MKQSDLIGFGLFVAFGLWWLLAPRSVIVFYSWLHRMAPPFLPKPQVIRVLGFVWITGLCLVEYLAIPQHA
jgi:hypothetical protein